MIRFLQNVAYFFFGSSLYHIWNAGNHAVVAALVLLAITTLLNENSN